MKSSELKKHFSKILVPDLRKNKWKGTGFDYNSKKGNIIRAIKIQPSRYGGEFCIDLGLHFDFIPIDGKDLQKLKAWDMEIGKRLTPNNEIDYWWRFPEHVVEIEMLIHEIKELILNKGEAYFNKFENWEHIFLNFSIEDIENGNVKEYFQITEVRQALLLAQINLYKNEKQKAIEFSKFALSKITGNVGSLLIPEFNEIISSATES